MPTNLDLIQAREHFEEAHYRLYLASKEYAEYPDDKSIHVEQYLDLKYAAEKKLADATKAADLMLYLYRKAIIESRIQGAAE